MKRPRVPIGASAFGLVLAMALGLLNSGEGQADGFLSRTFNLPVDQTGASFGAAISVGDVTGDTEPDVAVGSPGEDVDLNADTVAEADVGRVRIYDGITGGLLQTITSPNAEANGRFGAAVDVDPDNGFEPCAAHLVAGAPGETVAGQPGAGRAYLFDAGTGGLVETFEATSPQMGAALGTAVASDARVFTVCPPDVIAGAPLEDWDANGDTSTDIDAGRAYYFDGATGLLLHTLGAPSNSGQSGDQFGLGVAVIGNLVVGAPGKDAGSNTDQGRAYVYSALSGGYLRTLDSPNPQADGSFGAAVTSCAAPGELLVCIGAPLEDIGVNADAGGAYVVDTSDGSVVHTLASQQAEPGGRFGTSIGADEAAWDAYNNILVGAPYEDVTSTSDAGRVYFFSGQFGHLVMTLLPPTVQQDAHFGGSVAGGGPIGFAEGALAAGAPDLDTNSTDQGRAYLFRTDFGDTDSDGDGCGDHSELLANEVQGGRRNPKNPHDYFNPTGDGENRVDDIVAVVNAYYMDDNDGSPGLPPYAAGYNPDTDRSNMAASPNPWNTGAPDGLQRVQDIVHAVNSYFHDCW